MRTVQTAPVTRGTIPARTRSATSTVARAFRSELIKLRRPSTGLAIGLLGLLSVLSTVLVMALADETAPAPGTGAPPSFEITLAQLTEAEGLVFGFRGGTTFAGLLIFIVFTIGMTSEYGQGTLRTVFLREPRRLGWLAGRFGLMLSGVAIALLAAMALSIGMATVMAAIRDVDTSAWWTAAAAGEAASSYLNALLAATFFAIAGTALGIVLRSTTLALIAGIAWTFPLEHIIQDAWSPATGILPGLVFDAVGQGGLPDASYGSTLTLGAGYAVLAAVVGALSLTRRDVTA